MRKINVTKSELELYLVWIEKDFDRLSGISIVFTEFKDLFCEYDIDFTPSTHFDEYQKIYSNISSSDSKFYSKLRWFIIEKFLQCFSYCPYCWKTPLMHFDEDNKTKRMFQFDHFFPKNDFHKGVINFYNLIPSCNACNHIKLNISPLDWVFHPHFWWIKKNKNSIEILWDNFDDVSFCCWDINGKRFIFDTEHAKYFNLNQMYDKSIRDTSNVFDFIRDKEMKMKDEIKRCPWKFKNWTEAKKYFFDCYYSPDKDEITHHQNWKLKKDLIDNLKIKI